MFVSSTASATQTAAPSTAECSHAPGNPPNVEIDSLRLLQGQREVRIRHGNEWYRLRHTRNDKLILTK